MCLVFRKRSCFHLYGSLMGVGHILQTRKRGGSGEASSLLKTTQPGGAAGFNGGRGAYAMPTEPVDCCGGRRRRRARQLLGPGL